MAAQSEASHHFAADRRLPTGVPFHKLADMKRFFNNYRDIAEAEYGWTPGGHDFTVLRHIYVAESTEKAHEEARDHLEWWFDRLEGLFLGMIPRFMGYDGYDPEHGDAMLKTCRLTDSCPTNSSSRNTWTRVS
jgi:alkanesulfonate monooxygenase SsuD/methylene tetrahydromethanopterin reductase-like flavin-dependent oxidoreductase (luciferase family)